MASPEAAALASGRTVRFARRLSDLLSPPFVALFVFWVLAGSFAPDNRWFIFVVCGLAHAVLPMAYLKLAVHRGWIGDVNMSRRVERRVGLPMLGLVYLVGCVIVAGARVPAPVLVVCLASLVVLAGIWAANLIYKASGHVAGVTAYMTALSLLVEPLHLGLAVIPALSWARVRSGAHTIAQTIWGAVLGGVLVVVVYAALRRPLGI